MKKFNRSLCLFLAALMMAMTLAVTPAFAADYGYTYAITYDKDSETVTLEVSTLGEGSMLGIVGISYDPDALTFVDNEGNEVTEYTPMEDFRNKALNAVTKVGEYESGIMFIDTNGEKNEGTGVDKEKNVDTENGRIYFAWTTGFTDDSRNILLDDGFVLATLEFAVNDAALVEELVGKGELITIVDEKSENKFYSKRAYLSFEGRRSYSADSKPYIAIKYDYEGFETKPTDVEISITVKNEDGEPVVGAEVTIDEVTEITDENGVAKFTLPAGNYSYTVKADDYVEYTSTFNATGASAEVNADIVSIKLPAAPVMSDFTAITTSSVNVRWKKVVDNGGAEITKYIVEYGTSKTNLNKTKEVEITESNENTSVFSLKVTGLNDNTTYYFRVAAVNEKGTGEFSEAESVKTKRETSSGGSGSTGGDSGGSGTGTGTGTTTYYTVTYDAGAGKMTGAKSEQVARNASPKNVPTVTPPEGMKFDGWMNGTKKVDPATLKVAGNITLKASYVKIEPETEPGTGTETAVTHKSYINGYNENGLTLAKPGNNITRAEAVTIIARITPGFDENATYESAGFKDVGNEWYAKYINFAVSKKLVNGYPEDGTFRPQNEITREEFVTIIARLADYKIDNSKSFSDVPEDHWSKPNISTVAINKLVEGYPDGTFGFGRKITRAEVVTVINRYPGRVPDAELAKSAFSGDNLPAADIVDHWAFAQMVEAMEEHEASVLHK